MIMAPYQSLLVRLWNSFARSKTGNDRAAAPTADEIIEVAAKKGGYSDYTDDNIREPLNILLNYVAESESLHPFGRFYLNTFLAGLLTQRARLAGLWTEKPEILRIPIDQPLIILGLPRTGSSFLFNALAQDPSHRVITNWEAVVSQVPPNPVVDFHKDPRRRIGRWANRFQQHLAPALGDAHQFLLDGPEECTPLLMQSLTSFS